MDWFTVALVVISFLGGVALTLLTTERLVSLVVHAFLTVICYMLQAGQNRYDDTEELVVQGFGRAE